VALLVLQQLLGRLEKFVANVALKHSSDEVDLEVPFIHAARLAHKIAEDTLETWRESEGKEEKHELKPGSSVSGCLKRFETQLDWKSQKKPTYFLTKRAEAEISGLESTPGSSSNNTRSCKSHNKS